MNHSTIPKFHKVQAAFAWLPTAALPVILLLAFINGCQKTGQPNQPSNMTSVPPLQFESTGQDFLIAALDEVQAIADLNQALLDRSQTTGRRLILSKDVTDTVYVYGEITSDGYGAVVTERYAWPKGFLLITVRKSYGKEDGHIVTQTKRYTSYSGLANDNAQQSNLTELYGLSADTIVTHVLSNGALETYTFRLPVVSRTLNPQDGSVRVTTRFAQNGSIVSEVRDENDSLIQRRINTGQADGSLVTRTELPDGSWRQVRTVGQANGSVLRETTSSPS